MKDKEEGEKGTGEEKVVDAKVVETMAIAPRELTGDQMMKRMEMMDVRRKAFTKFVANQIKEGVHSYKLEGYDKPSLSKSGALLLNSFYGVRPEFSKEETHGENGQYAVSVKCKLYSLVDDALMGEGDASGSTREVKYRWRWLSVNKLPKGIDKSTLISSNRKNRKTGEWFEVFRMANDELWDLHNTILKVTCKRSLVAAGLTLPFASEVFTQDLEDMKSDEPKETESDKPKPSPKPSESKPSSEAPAQSAASEEKPVEAGVVVTGPQSRKLYAKFKFTGFDDEARHALLKEWYPDSDGHVFDEKSGKWLTLKQASELIETFEKGSDILTKWLKDFQEKQGR